MASKNSLSALALKIAAPGVFDLYQGCELWRYCLVDPDNRRPVDFGLRQKLLDENTHPKLSILSKGLQFRREHKDLILNGKYIPLDVGPDAIGYVRQLNGQMCIALSKRFFSKPSKLSLPPEWGGDYIDLYSNRPLDDQAFVLLQKSS